MKRKLLILSVLAICLAALTIGTVAFYTAEDQAHNVITTGGVSIALQEWADEAKTVPFGQQEASNVMPGSDVTKIVEVKNTGSSAAWVRIKVDTTVNDGALSADGIALDISSSWTLGEDGYYYYNSALAAGETTEPLFTKVSLSGEMGNAYQNATIAVDVTAMAVQTANNGASPQEAAGWPEA